VIDSSRRVILELAVGGDELIKGKGEILKVLREIFGWEM
jgi:hypothetical protein